MHPSIESLWWFLPLGYAVTIAIETPILCWGLSPRHSTRTRLFAGIWLTACTYPIVVLVLPAAIWPRYDDPHEAMFVYTVIAEIFAPVAECLLFFLIDRDPSIGTTSRIRDSVAIVAANVASFLTGLLVFG